MFSTSKIGTLKRFIHPQVGPLTSTETMAG